MRANDLEAKLASADVWVLREFRSLDDLLVAVGCERRDEAGPGRSYRLNGLAVVRLHPKVRWLGIGLPQAMRADVDALTGRLRGQQRLAWFNYSPDSPDRETVELLVDESVRLIGTRPVAEPGRDRRGGTSEPPYGSKVLDDEHDLALLLDLLTAFHSYERRRGGPTAVKVLREAIYFHWEGPRLPPGRTRSPHLLHSPAARAQRASGDLKGLVFEHVLPVSLVVRGLLSDLPTGTQGLARALRAAPTPVIITSAENAALDAAGMREAVPSDRDPWSRYRMAGLDPETFAPATSATDRHDDIRKIRSVVAEPKGSAGIAGRANVDTPEQ